MAFIACTTGTLAVFGRQDGAELAIPVEAWDEAGEAYVAGSHRLVAASSEDGFLRLEQAVFVVPDRSEPRPPVRVGRAPRPGRRPAPEGPRERPGV